MSTLVYEREDGSVEILYYDVSSGDVFIESNDDDFTRFSGLLEEE